MRNGKKHILITCPGKNSHGGVSSYYSALLPYLSKHESYNVELLSIGSRNTKNHFFHIVFDQIRFYFAIKKNNFDLVLVNPSFNMKSFFRDGLFVYVAKKKKIPVVVFFHSGLEETFERAMKRYLWIVTKGVYYKADAFIILNSCFKKRINRWFPGKPIFHKTTVVDIRLFKNFSLTTKLNSMMKKKNINILFLARLEYKKGILDTIDAFRTLASIYPNLTLTICGSGSAEKSVKHVLSKYALRDRANFKGYVSGDKKIQALTKGDIFCMPTGYPEGMPISVLEAMAFGMPIITCPNTGIKDIFQDGTMGYFVKYKDVDEIVKRIRYLLENREKMAIIAKYNHMYACKNFLSPTVVKNLTNIFGNILKLR